MRRRVMTDWEWEEWAERGERIERTLYRLMVVIGFMAIILANAYCLWLVASSLRDCGEAARGILDRVTVATVEAFESR